MSMLAGPRRKQKVINLRAQNNAWSNDSTKFGQRMLEKMGWSSGKGLGARENGIVEHVVARYKNDEKGLGFEDRNDQWTKHEDDFNALLANLSNGAYTGENTEGKLHSGVSLEEKSKKSRARIHYHKFTRGKDVTRYSEKDLANIFGKKSFKKEERIEKPVEDTQTTEQVFTEKGSMEDYFKSKMETFKSKNQLSCLANQDSLDSRDIEFGFRGFPGPNDNEETEQIHLGFGFQSFANNSNNDNKNPDVEPEHNEEKSSKKSKKKKKSKNKVKETIEDDEISHSVTDTDFNNAVLELEKDLLTKNIKKSKRKSAQRELPQSESNVAEMESPVEEKKNKEKGETREAPEHDADGDSNNAPSKKKKKKKKSKRHED